MSEEAQSVALERRPTQMAVGLISDDEVRRMYRIAEALALSDMFKDTKKAEQAFAKMIIGRDLGMSPAQSMLGLHLVEGSVMVHYAMLGRFIKAREDEGYAYRAGWLKVESVPDDNQVADQPTSYHDEIRSVWMDEDDPADFRDVVGAFVQFTIHDQVVGLSRFTLDDAQKAGLIKESAKAAWNAAPRNMLLARAMSNGVKWFVPEVMGGLPIYVEGEIVPDRQSVTAPVGEGGDEGQGVELGPKIESIISRAQELGHAGLSNRASIELAVGNRAPSVVADWVRRANEELDRFATEKVQREQEPEDAVVVEDKPLAAEKPIAEQVQEDRVVENMQRQVSETRLRQLEAARSEEQDPEQRALIDEEIAHVQAELADQQQ